MKKWLLVGLVLSLLVLTPAAPAAADDPIDIPLFIVFDDVNPCTGNVVTVTMIGSFVIHEHDGRSIVRYPRTITTSDGFVGRGEATEVVNGRIATFTLNDMLVHESGARFRSHFVTVVDLATSTVRVEPSGDTEICLGP